MWKDDGFNSRSYYISGGVSTGTIAENTFDYVVFLIQYVSINNNRRSNMFDDIEALLNFKSEDTGLVKDKCMEFLENYDYTLWSSNTEDLSGLQVDGRSQPISGHLKELDKKIGIYFFYPFNSKSCELLSQSKWNTFRGTSKFKIPEWNKYHKGKRNFLEVPFYVGEALDVRSRLKSHVVRRDNVTSSSLHIEDFINEKGNSKFEYKIEVMYLNRKYYESPTYGFINLAMEAAMQQCMKPYIGKIPD